MNLHEYQAKGLFTEYGIPVPAGKSSSSAMGARRVAEELNEGHWVVKAQVHAGGRGRAGGVKRVESLSEVEAAADTMLGHPLITHQSGPDGQPVNRVLVESACDIASELYLGMVVDRSHQRVVFMASRAGGMDIEEVAASTPEKIFTVNVNPVMGLQAYQCRRVAFGLGLEGNQIKELTRIMSGLYRLFMEKDASLVEVNPLVITGDGSLLALDAKVTLDSNALYRQGALAELRDPTQEDDREYRAQQHGLNYVSLNGNIGCMVNGAGLAMATMDLIKLHGGEPANFLDVGGGTTAERVAEAFKLILSDEKVDAILVNIFGGIVRCDLIAQGIIQALKEVNTQVSIVVRLEGTKVDEGRALLAKSGLAITTADDLTDAAQKAVAAAGGV